MRGEKTMLHPILADALLPGDTLSWVAGVVGVAAGLGFLWLLFSFLGPYVRCLLTGAGVGLFDLARMKWCHVDYEAIVKEKIKLTLAGLADVRTQDLETHALAKGNVTKVVDAVVAAHKAGIALTWDEAAAIDLAGRDVAEAVRTSVTPRVINCPDPREGRRGVAALCKNGVQVRVRARVTVRTRLDRLAGGATEETVIARVAEGIIKAIGNAATAQDLLADPARISQAVLRNGLDAGTAFEVVSVDIDGVEVGGNVGAELRATEAQAELKITQAQAELRRAQAQAQEQEHRAALALAEAEVPRALADALREGRLGVADLQALRNLRSDADKKAAAAENGLGRTEHHTG
jgi:uncharacterized protein YqfA (UPF0365 family)